MKERAKNWDAAELAVTVKEIEMEHPRPEDEQRGSIEAEDAGGTLRLSSKPRRKRKLGVWRATRAAAGRPLQRRFLAEGGCYRLGEAVPAIQPETRPGPMRAHQ